MDHAEYHSQAGRWLFGLAAVFQSKNVFLQTSWALKAKKNLHCKDLGAEVHGLSFTQVEELLEIVRRRNVFVRHYADRSFYQARMLEFANRTVIDFRANGDPDKVNDQAKVIAELLEKACVLSTTPAFPRSNLHRALAVTEHRREVVDLLMGQRFEVLRSSSKRTRELKGLVIDATFIDRFKKLGIESIVKAAVEPTQVGTRIREGLNWLFESRLEPHVPAAIVKTTIALESMLGGSASEPLRQTLSERSAFLLSAKPTIRAEVSHCIKLFYDIRSAVVHGSGKSKAKAIDRTLETIDRLTLFILSTLAANHAQFNSFDALRIWCEECRWGTSTEIKRPFSESILRHAIAYSTK